MGARTYSPCRVVQLVTAQKWEDHKLCINPRFIAELGVTVGCRQCWQCRSVRVNDYVGRMIAESKTCDRVYAVTLTYGHNDHYAAVDNPQAAVLNYKHVQDWLKRLRFQCAKHGGSLRYFASGEFGSKKGRSHWHVILFMYGQPPSGVKFDVRFPHWSWDYGYSFWQFARPEDFQYAAKYILKEETAGKQSLFQMSLKPALGDKYFLMRAGRFVEQSLSPQDLFYSFPESDMRFMLRGTMAYTFLSAFASGWYAKHGNHNWPQSELMDKWFDEYVRRGRIRAKWPDWPEDVYDRLFELRVNERRGQWLEDAGKTSKTLQLYPQPEKDGMPVYRVRLEGK